MDLSPQDRESLDKLRRGEWMESPEYFHACKLRDRMANQPKPKPERQKVGWVSVAKLGVAQTEAADVDIYGGRPLPYGDAPPGMIAGQLGNPFKSGGRDYNIARFKVEFEEGLTDRAKVWRDAAEWIFREARAGRNVRLWCHCSPKACHLDVIQREAILRLIFPETPFTPYSWEA